MRIDLFLDYDGFGRIVGFPFEEHLKENDIVYFIRTGNKYAEKGIIKNGYCDRFLIETPKFKDGILLDGELHFSWFKYGALFTTKEDLMKEVDREINSQIEYLQKERNEIKQKLEKL